MVGVRYSPIAQATSTPELALGRWFSTTRIPIPRLAPQPCCSTALAPTTRLLERMRLRTTLSTATQPLGFLRSSRTLPGSLETSVNGFALGPNTAIGSGALENNVDASANTALGYNALHSQVTGFTLGADPHLAGNTAVGFEALANVTGSATGDNAINTALGYQALVDFTDGDSNVAVGSQAGVGLTSGSGNIAVGFQAGVGLTSGNSNIFIGEFQGPAIASESNHTYIGNIRFTDVSGGGTDTVTIDLTTGLLGHLTSSRRYKEDIKPMDKASEALYRLKPVTYRYKKEIDRTQSHAFGLIAEEVAEVNPGLVAHIPKDRPRASTTKW